MTRNQHATTIKDIAQKLKLSVSTVSRALRGSGEIKEETRKLVHELAALMNYTPNPVALSLKEKRSKIIGVIVPEIANNFCSAAIAGIEDIAYSRGYHVVIFQSHENFEREVANTRLLVSRRIDGLIISISNETSSHEHLQEVRDKGIPLVMFDRVDESFPAPKVVVNDRQSAFEATVHLIREGYSRIAHIAGSRYLSISRNRLQGYKDALNAHGIPLREEWILHSSFDQTEVERAICRLFEGPHRPDAILASAERLLTGCLRSLKKLGLKVPDDVALIGFSDNPLNSLLSPSVSCIRQPAFEIGQRSAAMLIDLIENKTPPEQYQTIQLETLLDIRNSSTGRMATA